MRSLPLCILFSCAQAPTTADLLFHGGTILTANGETTAIAVSAGEIVAVGEQALAMPRAAEVDLEGTVLGAGLHDGHTHLLAASFVNPRIVLLLVSSMESVAERVAAYGEAHPEEPWLVGFGWSEQALDIPDGRLLDQAIPDRPVLLIAGSGHEALVNTYALRLAGIDADTPDPPGGTIVRDPETGEPTGRLIEGAMALVVGQTLAAYSDATLFDDFASQLREAASMGLTSVSEILGAPGIDLIRPELLTALEQSGRLPLRVHWFVPVTSTDQLAAAAELRDQHPGDLAHFGGAKAWVDGALGGLEAWTRDEYQLRGGYGSHYLEQSDLEALLREGEALGVPLKLHAMGDAALEATIAALEAVDTTEGLQLHHSIEHVSLLDDGLLNRLALLDVTASVQPISRALVSLSGVQHELEHWEVDDTYDQAALATAGVSLAVGTDYPANPNLDPMATLAGVYGDHRAGALTMDEALEGYTLGSARSAGLDGTLGCMDVGCLADFVQYSGNPRTEDPRTLSVLGTWVGGRRR